MVKALRYDAIITAEVKDERPKRSPVVQGGLEVLIETSIVWDDAAKIKKKKRKIRNCSNRGQYIPKELYLHIRKQRSSKRNEMRITRKAEKTVYVFFYIVMKYQ